VRRAPLLVVVLLVWAASQAWAADRGAWDLVWKSEAAAARLSLQGQIHTMILMGPRPLEAVATASASKGKIRFDYVMGPRRWSLIDDGQSLIWLRPDEQRASLMRRPTFVADRKLAERNYVARLSAKGTIAGRPTRVVEILPRAGGPAVWRLWMDSATSCTLKRERYNVEGKLTSATEYQTVRFGVPLPATLFVVPPGWQSAGDEQSGERMELARLTRAAGFAVAKPKYMPTGYALLGGYFQHGEAPREGPRRPPRPPGVELRYSDGIRVVSVYERAPAPPRPERADRPGGDAPRPRHPEPPEGEHRHRRPEGARSGVRAVDNGMERVVRFHGKDRVVMVVGDLTEAELTRIAKSAG